MASRRRGTASRGRSSPASIMPSMAALMASDFIFMKSVSVLSRSKTIARINQVLPAVLAGRGTRGGPTTSAPRSLAGDPNAAAQADLAIVDAHVESACGIAAHPCLVGDRCALAAVVGERQQYAVVALATLRKVQLQPQPPPASSRRLAPPLLPPPFILRPTCSPPPPPPPSP